MSEVRFLREKSLVLCVSRLCDSCLSKGVRKVLASEAHHERLAGSELLSAHRGPGAWRCGVDDVHDQLNNSYVLLSPSFAVNAVERLGSVGENGGMSESRSTLQFDLDLEAVRLLHRSVSFHLEKWPGGPDPREQEALQSMKTLLTAALLEFSLDQDGQR